jgi:hypothetical protein
MLIISRPLTIYAVKKLATVDYTVANRVTEDVAQVVQWAYNNDLPWIPPIAMDTLHTFDDLGSMLIMFVMWLVHHTK